MRAMNVIDKLREQGKMTWIDEEHGWIAARRTLDLEPNPYTENGGES